MQQLTVTQIPTVQPANRPGGAAARGHHLGRQWPLATARGLPRSAGHRAGAESARRVIEAAPRIGIHTLTLFALSSANWKRPAPEVNAILRLLHEYLLTETTHCIDEGVRLSIIGRRDRLPATLRQAITDSEAATANGSRLHLRLAVDYPLAKPSIMPLAGSIKSPNSRPNLSVTCLRKCIAAARRKSIC